jgi:biopolymer transport protein ExbD
MKKRKRHSGIDMSSLMDIIFILLIFVMLSMSFQKNFQSLEMNLPKSEVGEKTSDTSIRIALKENGEIFIDEKPSNWENLELELKNIENKEIQLSLEEKVYYGEFIRISEILKKLNLNKISLIVHKK